MAGMGGRRGQRKRSRKRPVLGRRWLRRLWPIVAAVGAGILLLAAFPPIDLWWIAPLGVALLGLATYRRGFWAGAGLGMLTGLSLLIPLLSWAGGFVGPVWLFLPVRRGVLLRSARWPVGYGQPGPETVAVELAARHRVLVGAAGGPAGSDAVRRLPVGPARVQPG